MKGKFGDPRSMVGLFVLSFLPLPVVVLLAVTVFGVPFGWALGLAGLSVALGCAVWLVFLLGRGKTVGRLFEPPIVGWVALVGGIGSGLSGVLSLFWAGEMRLWVAVLHWVGAATGITLGAGLLLVARRQRG